MTKRIAEMTPEEAEKFREARRNEYYRRSGGKPRPPALRDQRAAAKAERKRQRYFAAAKHVPRVEYLARIKLPEHQRGKKARASKAARHLRKQQFVQEYKRSHPCVDCGYDKDIRALQFDHRDRATKLKDVARLIAGGASMKRLEAEIAKCDVRCANCHTIRSQAEQHWREVEDWERVSKN